MAFDFPSSPTENQVYTPAGGPTYTYRAPAWRVDYAAGSGGGSSKVTISDSAPASPTAGDQWLKGDSGELFAWFDDGSSQQWVQTNGAMLAGPTPAIVKISEAAILSGASQLDVSLPAGYRGYELLLYDYHPSVATQFSFARVSYDNGVTFPTTVSYAWGLDYITTAASGGWAMEGSTATLGSFIKLTPTAIGTGVLSAGFMRLRIPRATAAAIFHMMWDGEFYSGSGGNYHMVRGHGRYLGIAGPPTHIRIGHNGGTFTLAGGWQLLGWL